VVSLPRNSPKYGEHRNTTSLTPEEKCRCAAIFNRLDRDRSGTIDIEELGVVVNLRDSGQMMAILDANGNNEISIDEWHNYCRSKKHDKGPHKFTHFLGYVEQKVVSSTATATTSSPVKPRAGKSRGSRPSQQTVPSVTTRRKKLCPPEDASATEAVLSSDLVGKFDSSHFRLEAELPAAEVARRKACIRSLFINFDSDGVIEFAEFQLLARIFEGDSFSDEVARKVDANLDGGISEDDFGDFVFRQTQVLSESAFDSILVHMLDTPVHKVAKTVMPQTQRTSEKEANEQQPQEEEEEEEEQEEEEEEQEEQEKAQQEEEEEEEEEREKEEEEQEEEQEQEQEMRLADDAARRKAIVDDIALREAALAKRRDAWTPPLSAGRMTLLEKAATLTSPMTPSTGSTFGTPKTQPSAKASTRKAKYDESRFMGSTSPSQASNSVSPTKSPKPPADPFLGLGFTFEASSEGQRSPKPAEPEDDTDPTVRFKARVGVWANEVHRTGQGIW